MKVVRRTFWLMKVVPTWKEFEKLWYSLLLLGYKPVQHVTVLNTVGNCNTVGSIIILYYNIILLYYGTAVVYAVRRWPKRRYAAHDCI